MLLVFAGGVWSVLVAIGTIDLVLVERRPVWHVLAFTILGEVIYFAALFVSLPSFGDEASVSAIAGSSSVLIFLLFRWTAGVAMRTRAGLVVSVVLGGTVFASIALAPLLVGWSSIRSDGTGAAILVWPLGLLCGAIIPFAWWKNPGHEVSTHPKK